MSERTNVCHLLVYGRHLKFSAAHKLSGVLPHKGKFRRQRKVYDGAKGPLCRIKEQTRHVTNPQIADSNLSMTSSHCYFKTSCYILATSNTHSTKQQHSLIGLTVFSISPLVMRRKCAEYREILRKITDLVHVQKTCGWRNRK